MGVCEIIFTEKKGKINVKVRSMLRMEKDKLEQEQVQSVKDNQGHNEDIKCDEVH